jgi:LacI family transcriptional regulator
VVVAEGPRHEVMALAKIKDVAKLAGVAPSSVSRALSNHPDVSEAMRSRVLRAAEHLEYRPNLLAQGLRRGQTRTVGFIVRDISIPTFAGIVKGAEEEFESLGYSILVTNSLQSSALEAKHVEVLSQRQVDGLILSLQSESCPETIRALERVQVPIVLLDRELDSIDCDSVCFDHATGVRGAIEALIELGHRRIGFIGGSADRRASRDRLDGYRSALESAGIPMNDSWVLQLGVTAHDEIHGAVLELLRQKLRPTAILASDGNLGVALLTGVREYGIALGTDIAVVICDDHELLHLMEPPISVVSREVELMGRCAARLLMRRLDGSASPPVREILPTTFIRRSLSGPVQSVRAMA